MDDLTSQLQTQDSSSWIDTLKMQKSITSCKDEIKSSALYKSLNTKLRFDKAWKVLEKQQGYQISEDETAYQVWESGIQACYRFYNKAGGNPEDQKILENAASKLENAAERIKHIEQINNIQEQCKTTMDAINRHIHTIYKSYKDDPTTKNIFSRAKQGHSLFSKHYDQVHLREKGIETLKTATQELKDQEALWKERAERSKEYTKAQNDINSLTLWFYTNEYSINQTTKNDFTEKINRFKETYDHFIITDSLDNQKNKKNQLEEIVRDLQTLQNKAKTLDITEYEYDI
jgi:hypothetical protein